MALGTIAAIGAGVSLGSSLIGARRQKSAGKEAEALASQNAARIAAETDKTIERTRASQEQAMGATRARQGGSGVKAGAGSTQVYLDEMQRVFQDDLDWIKESGASQESITRAEGSLANKQATANAWGTIASGASSLMAFWK